MDAFQIILITVLFLGYMIAVHIAKRILNRITENDNTQGCPCEYPCNAYCYEKWQENQETLKSE